MMKSVLIAIRPKWCEKIASGQKTIEVRKSRPKIEMPFKCYIYRTTKKVDEILEEYDSNFNLLRRKKTLKKFRGKVIGEFICDRIDEYKYVYCDHPEIGYPVGYDCGDNWYDIDDEDLQKACLTEEEFKRYGNGKPLYGWHISDLKIYDRPRELSEFSRPCSYSGLCFSCKRMSFKKDGNLLCNTKITRPPQSWMHVEDLGEEE